MGIRHSLCWIAAYIKTINVHIETIMASFLVVLFFIE